MFSRVGAAAYKKDIGNTVALCNFLGNPQENTRCIHIAGTNGKGSTAHMLASILQEAGYKTGLYTSPHIKDFGERIRINGKMISQEFVSEFVERIKPAIAEIQPSFFELTVAMALEYFKQNQVSVAVIETGLGGRLDSTNIITPVLSVITNVGLDHTDLLGKTLHAIAGEKAGIIKQGIPVVVGEVTDETLPVFAETSAKMQSEMVLVTERYITEYISREGNLLLVNLKNVQSGTVEKLRLELEGLYQARNAATVLCAVDILRKTGWEISEDALHKGFESVRLNTGLRGRWEVVSHKPYVVLDVAHNQDGFKTLVNQLEIQFHGKQWHIILGFVKDKDITGILEVLPQNAHYYFTQAHIPRALQLKDLEQYARRYNLAGTAHENVNEAMKAALGMASDDDVVICCGSFYILSELDELG